MVDLSAMWIHQRVGPNTGISFGLGGMLIGIAVVAYLCFQVVSATWPVLCGVAVAGLATYMWKNRHGYCETAPEDEQEDAEAY